MLGYGKFTNMANSSLETPKMLFSENLSVNISLFSVQGSMKNKILKAIVEIGRE